MAHWIITDKGFGGQFYQCSECSESWCDIFHNVSMEETCPNCGAQIDEDATEYVEEIRKRLCSFDRNTALSILKDLSKDLHPNYDLFGRKILTIDRDKFEAVRKKYLD